MKHLKSFENFDLGRFDNADSDEQEWLDHVNDINHEKEETSDFEEEDDQDDFDDDLDISKDERESKLKVWGDEGIVENISKYGLNRTMKKQRTFRNVNEDTRNTFSNFIVNNNGLKIHKNMNVKFVVPGKLNDNPEITAIGRVIDFESTSFSEFATISYKNDKLNMTEISVPIDEILSIEQVSEKYNGRNKMIRK